MPRKWESLDGLTQRKSAPHGGVFPSSATRSRSKLAAPPESPAVPAAAAALSTADRALDSALARRLASTSQPGVDRPEDAKLFTLDALSALDGFGVFLKGATPGGQPAPKRLFLRLDGLELEADPASVALSRAKCGVTTLSCLFPADAPAPPARDAALRLVFGDGRGAVCPLADATLERFVPDGEGGQFRRFYSHMEREPFFGRYAKAYYQLCAAAFADCVLDTHEPAPVPLIFAAPTERPAQFLLFDQLRRHLRKSFAPGFGVTVAAAEAQRHGETRELFFSLKEDLGAPCSLAFVREPRAAIWALDALLPALGATAFAYVGADVVLSARGWAALPAALESIAGLALLQPRDPCEPWREPERAMHAFVWTAQEFLDWRRGVQLPIGFAPPLGALESEASILPNCGDIDFSASPAPVLSWINRHAGVQL